LAPAAAAGARAGQYVKAVLVFQERTVSILSELWSYMRDRKKLWMLPIFVMVLLLGALLILAKTSVVAPFIYTLF
jgi:hypothetical protein